MITYGAIFDVIAKEKKIEELEFLTTDNDFWNDQKVAQKILKEKRQLQIIVNNANKIYSKGLDTKAFLDLFLESKDSSLLSEIEQEIINLEKDLESFELETILNDEDDIRTAIVTIHPGAGGTESHDWASMLYRMYKMWVEDNKYKMELIDYQDGEIAGCKGASFRVIGDYAFGYLKAESGVHRLIRISPFDSNARRHTSFASVFVYPEIDDDIEIEVNPSDIRVDTFRASGAGGQHVNKTESAIRITHFPTGLVVQCQDGRSQIQNRETAMKMLKSRMYQLEKDRQKEARDKLDSTKMEIGFGSQIRTYTFHPYNLVKDHRTSAETSNVIGVMNGNIDLFIKAYLNTKK